jgi:hypothetical protein
MKMFRTKRKSNPADGLLIDGVQHDVSNLSIQPREDYSSQRINPADQHQKKQLSRSRHQKTRSCDLKNSSSDHFGLERSDSFQNTRNSNEFSETSQRFGLKQAPSYSYVQADHQELTQRIKHNTPQHNLPYRSEHDRVQFSNHDRQGLGPMEEIISASPRPAITVEIGPGVHETLRGSVETTCALQRGDITRVRCCCCAQDVSCISDAAFFICPTCRVISNVPGTSGWGVGLGFVDKHVCPRAA